LTRGQSTSQSWTVDSQYPQARLTVGSAADAGWSVQGAGVLPIHFELFWDGTSLWITDPNRTGSVALDGRPVNDWVQIRGRAEISFGSAAMVVETFGPASQQMASSPGAAGVVSVGPSSAPRQKDEEELSGEATRIAPPPSEESSAWGDLSGEATRIAPEAYGEPALSPEATRIAPESAVIPPPPGAPRLRLGGEPNEPGIGAKNIRPESAGPSIVVQPGPLQPPPAPAGFGLAPVAGYPPSAAGGGPGGPGFGAPFVPPPPGELQGAFGVPKSNFMGPPTFEAAQKQLETGDKNLNKVLASLKAVPPRTWVLAGVAVLAVVGLFLLSPSEEEPRVNPPVTGHPPAGLGTAPNPAGQPGATPTPPSVPATSPVPPLTPTTVATPTRVGPPMQPLSSGSITTPGVSAPALVPTPPTTSGVPSIPLAPIPTHAPDTPTTSTGAGAAGQPSPPVTPTPERIAADLVINGQFEQALGHYQALAQAHPERPEYTQVVRILQKRIAQRCQGGVRPDGRPCTPPP
jgi:hypothetical protein